MASNCCYFTSDSEKFFGHLTEHRPVINYLRCSYCLYEADNPKNLLSHMTLHGYDKYQCQHCFYRSVVAGNVAIHSEQYHRGKSHLVLVNRQKEIDERQELKRIRTENVRFVRPMKCFGESFKIKMYI